MAGLTGVAAWEAGWRGASAAGVAGMLILCWASLSGRNDVRSMFDPYGREIAALSTELANE